MIPDNDPTAINVQADADTHRICGTTWHGNIDFDMPVWSYVDRNLWQGGYLPGVKLSHFKHVISLYPWEQYKSIRRLATDVKVYMFDDLEQNLSQVDALGRLVNVCREDGPTLVHCQAGLNRSSLVVARALFLQGEEGDDIVEFLRQNRSPAVLCNPAFEAEVRSWSHQKRWITVGWSPSWPIGYSEDSDGSWVPNPDGPHEAVMNLNGRPRAYYDLKQAQRALPQLSRDARILELDFNDQGAEGKWVE